MPRPGPGSTDVMFADDVTQIIETNFRSKRALAIKTEREIERINRFEKDWKIQTNSTKFKILSISKSKPREIRINNRLIPFSNSITVLGMTIKRSGIAYHVKQRMGMAKQAAIKLRRFRGLNTKTKMHLYKALVRPVVEYPNIPICITSKTNKNKIQKIQNKYIRFAMNNRQASMEEIRSAHEEYKLETVNTRMHRRANRTWDKLTLIEEELVERSRMEDNRDETKDHNWWPRVSPFVNGDQPEPLY